MITLDDYKKLMNFQGKGYLIKCNGNEVFLIDEDNFIFTDDKYTTNCWTIDYLSVEWTVEKVEQIDWKNI